MDGQMECAGSLPPGASSSRRGARASSAMPPPMSSTGTTTCSSIGLRWPASTIVTGRGVPSSEPPRNRRSPPTGAAWRRDRYPLKRVVAELSQTLEREGQVGAALGRCHRVDLVDDRTPNAPERLPRGGREHQVERFGRGGQRCSGGRRIIRCRSRDGVSPVRIATSGAWASGVPSRSAACIPRAARGGSSRCRRRVPGAARRRERGSSPWVGRRRFRRETIDRPQEGGERLARPRGREDQRVVAVGDRLPPVPLGARGRLERGREPVADGGGEDLEGHRHTLPGDTDMREGAGRMPRHASAPRPRRRRSPSWSRRLGLWPRTHP